jgi:Ribonuclease P 40kDa (Rpp40) subunit
MDGDGEYWCTTACSLVKSSFVELIDTRPRLQANDRVDPYVAVYSPPVPFAVGDMVHIRWHGFLTPQFVQRVIDTATCVATLCLFVDGERTRAERFCPDKRRHPQASLSLV